MAFDTFIEQAEAIFSRFPNRAVWNQGGPGPNRQIENPEAGYCIILRYDDPITSVITDFMDGVRAVLPPVVSYSSRTVHSTLGVFGKVSLVDFSPDEKVFSELAEAVEVGMAGSAGAPGIALGKWLYNREALLVSARPNEALWGLWCRINEACRDRGLPLTASRILHVTTARFVYEVSQPVFQQFAGMVETAPLFGWLQPVAIDVGSWRCDGLTFDLDIYRRLALLTGKRTPGD